MSTIYLPVAPVVIATAVASTAFTAVNASGGDKVYTFSCTQACYIKRGLSTIAAADTTDFLLPANTLVQFALAKNEGVRAIRVSADGILQIGDTSH